MFTDDKFLTVCERYREIHEHKSGEALTARYNEVLDRMAELNGYARRSGSQDDELDELNAERGVLDLAISDRKVLARSEAAEARKQKIAEISRAYADPANHEAGADTGIRPLEAPAHIRGKLGDRPESAAEVIARSGNPWAARSGPLDGHTTYGRGDTGAGVIARAHTALEALEDTLTRDGCEKLADAMAESSSWGGITVRRSREEQARAAELWLALSNPHYAEAFRSVLRYPGEFSGGGAVGYETFTDEQRHAWRDVRTNELARAAFAETSGAAGAFAIPLDLHPDIILTNAGSANPFRKLARNVISTTNVAEFVTSAGTTANWLPEGQAVTDTTPTLGQLAVTHYKESVWVYGSFELWQDAPSLNEQVPALIADAKDRLEVAAFALGTGSGQPFGLLVHGTSDATATALTAALVYALHQALPPRFRVGDGSRPVWLANVAIINALRQIPSFTGSVTSLVNDNQADSIPEVLSIDVMECSAMASAQTTGNKTLALADMSQFIITNRQPELLIHEPLVKATASGFPTGQSGWFSWSRTGSDLAVPTACQYHTN